MLITEIVAEIQRGNVQALITLRRAFDLIVVSDVFHTGDVRDEMALAQTIGLMHRIERRLRAPKLAEYRGDDSDGTLDYNEMVARENVRHAAIETIDEVMQA